MISPVILRQWVSLLILTAAALAIFGCASPASKKHSPAIDEEAYIDLKQGFSLVVPATWEREHIPVSSPLHRPNTVAWLINGPNNTKTTFQVSVKDSLILTDYLGNLDNGRFNLTEEMARSIPHHAGSALRWESEDNRERIILLTVEGPKRMYVITAKVAAANYNQLLPTFEKVISSFSILPN